MKLGRQRQALANKRGCVINADALWLLTVAGRAVMQVEGIAAHEYEQLAGAVAAGQRSINHTETRAQRGTGLEDDLGGNG